MLGDHNDLLCAECLGGLTPLVDIQLGKNHVFQRCGMVIVFPPLPSAGTEVDKHFEFHVRPFDLPGRRAGQLRRRRVGQRAADGFRIRGIRHSGAMHPQAGGNKHGNEDERS